MPPTVVAPLVLLPEVRRLEGQALPFLGERGFEFGQRRAGAHGDDQLAGLVARDAGEPGGAQGSPCGASP
jgi:hypothetical protein